MTSLVPLWSSWSWCGVHRVGVGKARTRSGLDRGTAPQNPRLPSPVTARSSVGGALNPKASNELNEAFKRSPAHPQGAYCRRQPETSRTGSVPLRLTLVPTGIQRNQEHPPQGWPYTIALLGFDDTREVRVPRPVEEGLGVVVRDGVADPPEVMRRKVRNILRHERELRGITQKAAAERVLWSQSKLMRIETGVTPAVPADVRLLLLEYGADEARVAEVVEIAKGAWQPDEWETYKGIYSTAALNLFANEGAATLIQKYEPTFIPGLFQTEDYTRALLKETRSNPEQIDNRVRGRLRRQEMLGSDDCPNLNIIIGEATVSRPIGGNKVMREQVDKLKKLTTHNKVILSLIPFSRGAHPGLGSAFTILEFNDPDLADLVYLEGADRESIVRDDQGEVDRYNRRFAELRELAIPPEDLPAFLDEIVKYRFNRS